MIYLSLSSDNERILEQAAILLVKNQLVIDLNMERHTERIEIIDEQISRSPRYLLRGKTKALLFPAIDDLLRAEFPDDMPEVYAYPIVYMDWDQARHLRNEVQAV